MRVLVTAGGTSEPIDRVRKITNMATGRLGSLIAEGFAKEKGAQVTYLCTRDAYRPASIMEQTYTIGSVLELEETLIRLLHNGHYDAVVHSMAVSDYMPRRVMDARELAESIAGALEGQGPKSREELVQSIHSAILQGGAPAGSSGKFSSNIEHMLLRMDKAPKVIRHIKKLQPDTVLVGFKLLAGAEPGHLRQIARDLMQANDCDYVLANDLDDIDGNIHKALFIGPDGTYTALQKKTEIAEAIVQEVSRKVRQRGE